MDIVDIVDIMEPLWNILQCRASQCFEENQRIFSAGASEQRVFQDFFLIGDFWTGVGGCKMLLRGKRYS